MKHADCDGDGSVALSDENLIRANLNQTHSGYKDKMEFLDGDEFVLVNNSGKSEFKLGTNYNLSANSIFHIWKYEPLHLKYNRIFDYFLIVI